MEFSLCGLTTPGYGSCPRMWLIYPLSLHCRNWFSLFSSYQLHISLFWFRAGLCALLPSSVVEFCLPGIYKGLVRTIAMSGSSYVSSSALLYLKNVVSLKSPTTSGSSRLSAPSSKWISEPWGEGCDTRHPIWGWTFQSLLFPVLTPIYCKNFSDESWVISWTMGLAVYY